jgi:hypothetical protein
MLTVALILMFGMAWFWGLWIAGVMNASTGFALARFFAYESFGLTQYARDGFLIFSILHCTAALAAVVMAMMFVAGTETEDRPFY